MGGWVGGYLGRSGRVCTGRISLLPPWGWVILKDLNLRTNAKGVEDKMFYILHLGLVGRWMSPQQPPPPCWGWDTFGPPGFPQDLSGWVSEFHRPVDKYIRAPLQTLGT